MSTAIHNMESNVPGSKQGHRVGWLFSPVVDLWAFLGSALISLLLLAVGHWLGILHARSPEWTWFTTVLLIDVAHVYATCWRVYFDKAEFQRRRALYLLTPAIIFAIGWAVHSESTRWFWTILAYMAVFHFVRQQYGWVALYRARANDRSRWIRWLDTAAIYSATCYPLIWWHINLPRRFEWMVSEDFSAAFVESAPPIIEPIFASVYWAVLSAYFGVSIWRGTRSNEWNPGKDIVVLTTAVCWYVGIITFNSDYAFTVTNVIIHGVPYFVLVYWYRFHWQKSKSPAFDASIQWDDEFNLDLDTETCQPEQARAAMNPRIRRLIIFMGTLWLLAYIEELFWHQGVWQTRSWLFGNGLKLDASRTWLVPLLAVPQLTHYVLDGFIWRRRSNPGFDRNLSTMYSEGQNA